MKITKGITTLFLVLVSASLVAQEPEKLVAKVEAMAKVGACYSPSFSPDGSEIVFISNMSGIPQLWKIPREGGWPTQLTNFDDPVSNATWSPKGNNIAFQLAPGGGMNSQVYLMMADGSQVHQITHGGKTNNWVGTWSDDGNYLSYSSNQNNPSGMDNFLYNIRTQSIEWNVKNQGIGSINDINKDNNQLLVSRLASRGSNDIYLVNRAAEETLLTEHDGPGSFYATFSPDGEVYLASKVPHPTGALLFR